MHMAYPSACRIKRNVKAAVRQVIFRFMKSKPILALTMGDINGVGPEILAKALARHEVGETCTPVVYGCPAIYEPIAKGLDGAKEAVPVANLDEAARLTSGLPFLPQGRPQRKREPGVLCTEAAATAMAWIAAATDDALAGRVDGIVTCPINKEGIHGAGYTCSGHTDFIAQRSGASDYRMCLFAGNMRIVHVSGHVSLRQALDGLDSRTIAASIEMGHDALVRLGTPRRRIAVAGINPHAGEGGAFGSEEKEIIVPAIETCKRKGLDCSGPYPADVIFRQMRAGAFDLVIAMYHDQGHAPLKLIAMDDCVNVTLGIPFVRTSVGHGTAYDIAGKGIARDGSLLAALKLAADLALAPPSDGS